MVDPDAGRTKETNWLRDILPRLLEQDRQQAIYPRVMTYGYNADVWMTKTVADLDAPVANLLNYLAMERHDVSSLRITTESSLLLTPSKDPGRPLFFIGHSLGGIVIKQVCQPKVALQKVTFFQTLTLSRLLLLLPNKLRIPACNQHSQRSKIASLSKAACSLACQTLGRNMQLVPLQFLEYSTPCSTSTGMLCRT